MRFIYVASVDAVITRNTVDDT